MTEIWKTISEYPKYSISNFGRVMNIETGKIRKTSISKKGYERVGLRPSKNPYKKQPDYLVVHRLVAKAFLKNTYNKPEINHIDGNKLNNISSNLEWSTPSENQIHAYKTRLQVHVHGEGHFASKLTDEKVREIRALYKSGNYFQYEIAEKFGINQQNVSLICSNRAWTHVKDVEPRR